MSLFHKIVFYFCVFLVTSFAMPMGAVKGAELTVGVSTGYPPYYFLEDGKLVGACIDTIDQVAADLGYTVIYKQFPWKRMMLSARQGQVDAVMPLFRTKERDAFLYFNNLELVDEENRLFTWKKIKVPYNGSFQEISSYSLGVVAEYSYGRTFDGASGLNKVVAASDSHLIEMFRARRFDIGIGNQDVVLFFADKLGIGDQI